MKKSLQRGKNPSKCEVLGASPFGIWLLFNKVEYYLNYHSFPWFRKATLESIMKVKVINREHLYWPDLDIDLHIDSITSPQHFPLIAKSAKKSTVKQISKKKKVA